jgi:hypothetical protein
VLGERGQSGAEWSGVEQSGASQGEEV